MQVTLLKEEDIWGDNALDVITSYGTKTSLTDLAVLLGGWLVRSQATIEGKKTGYCWSVSPSTNDYVICVNIDGDWDSLNADARGPAARLVLPSSETSKIRPNDIKTVALPNGKKIKTCEFGMYPQTAADDDLNQTLSMLLKRFQLKKLPQYYTFDAQALNAYGAKMTPEKHPVYEYQGEKYIMVEGKPADSNSVLADGREVKKEETYWVKVEPIEWLMDEKTGTWVAKEGLFAGIPFNASNKYDGNFAKTDMNEYLQKYFAPEMTQTFTHAYARTQQQTQETTPRSKRRGYGVTIDERPMSAKEQMEMYIQNGMSFMLHGKSGTGKSKRVKELDPNLTMLTLANGMMPEDVIGKVIYPDGQTDANGTGGVWVPPDWYVDLKKKCAAEPDKKHVLFIDEVANARETTQSLIFHLVLEHAIAQNKGKIPDNAVIVLAGNSTEESGAAYNIPEPLFRRVPHIYLEPRIDDWLEWGSEKKPEASEETKIHPLVSSFVATYGEDVFFTPYDEEDPQQWAMDPRGWEQVSDIIYRNKGVIRRELLENKMGPELAANFIGYAKNPPMMAEDIIEGTYTPDEIPNTPDAKLALTLSLRYVDRKNVEKVRDFIGKQLSAENLAVFDKLWIGQSDERAVQIGKFRENAGGR